MQYQTTALVGILLTGVLCLPLFAESVTVAETTNGKVSRHTETLTVSESSGQRVETLVTPDGTTKRTFDARGTLLSVEWSGSAGAYSLVKDGEVVKADGNYLGKPVAGKVELKGRLWDRGGGEMDFSVAFKALAKQGFRGEITMVTIAPDDVGRPVEMSFSKDGDEVIGGRQLVRVKLGLTGLLALLWNGLAWVDPSTGAKVRLKSTKGPGTPETLSVSEVIR